GFVFSIIKVPLVLRRLHNINVGGRIQGCRPTGRDKLIKDFNNEHYFHGIRKCVIEFLKNCSTCQKTVSLPHIKAPPIPIRTYFPHQRLQMDLIQMASKRKAHMILNPWRFSYILSVKCCFSKYGWLFPLRNKKISGVYLAMKFLCEKEGFPEIMQSDNGKEFVGKIVKEFFKSHEVRIKHGRPRHPQSQGQVENLNKTVKNHLKRLLCELDKEQQGKIWPLLLPGIATTYNNSYHHTIEDIPFRLYHNREPNQLKHYVVPDDYDWCLQTGTKNDKRKK
uniref:Integrase catalytic domain-containing protein n=1 Tax=Clytia hemisphaerica TaxID=252671 RepID=A0A7M6DL59_9CNID